MLEGVRVSVAVTGLQSSEEAAAAEGAVLSFRPLFVALIDTNAWNFQALSFTENQIARYVNNIYGGEVELVTTDNHGGRSFTWSARDGRKAFALVRDGLIFFGNDEAAIDRSVTLLNGAGESITVNEKVGSLPTNALASGYVSREGIGQLANIAGVSLAIGSGDDGAVRNFVSRIVPEITRYTATEATWIARAADEGRIEDLYTIFLEPETARVLAESVSPAPAGESELSRFVPLELISATRYNLSDPQIAWRGILMTARTKTDAVTGSLLTAFSSVLFSPFGIDDEEVFLKAAASEIQTVRLDEEGDEVAVILRPKDFEALRRAIASEIPLTSAPEKFENADIWRSANNELAAARFEDILIIGQAKAVEKCLAARNSGRNSSELLKAAGLSVSSSAIFSYNSDADDLAGLVPRLSGSSNTADRLPPRFYTVESSFNARGLERRTISDFGLVGSLVSRSISENKE